MKDLILKYNQQAPRYTSYPPATEFHEELKQADYTKLILDSNYQSPQPISLYFHFPYCPQRCHFCGCNSYLGQSEEETKVYMKGLLKEVDATLDLLDLDRPLTQIHWGGGTPNSMDYRLLGEVMDRVLRRVKLAPHAELAIECNPAYLEKEHIPQLREMGFNRLSLGIQDFDPKVLKAVNRAESKLDMEELMQLIRDQKFDGVNLDFIYGLPLQSVDSFLKAINRAIALEPDRLVTFSYAHVPWVKSEQKILEEYNIPGPEAKLDMLLGGMDLMKQAGYQMIGMDHYARPDDALGMASKKGQLHRNFQGYCTRESTGQVYAFGASSISQLQDAYIQNVRHPKKYLATLDQDGTAFQRGYVLREDQKLVRSAISEVMCNGVLDFELLAEAYRWCVDDTMKHLNYSPEQFQDLEADGLLTTYPARLELSLAGKLLSRLIAQRLDPMKKSNGQGFSKTI